MDEIGDVREGSILVRECWVQAQRTPLIYHFFSGSQHQKCVLVFGY